MNREGPVTLLPHLLEAGDVLGLLHGLLLVAQERRVDADLDGVGGQPVHAKEAPGNVADGGDDEGPPVHDLEVKDDGGAHSGDDVAKVLVTCPSAEDEAAVILRLGVAEPVAHDGGADGAPGRLEEPEDEVRREVEEVSESGRDALEVEEDANGHGGKADAATEEAATSERGVRIRLATRKRQQRDSDMTSEASRENSFS